MSDRLECWLAGRDDETYRLVFDVKDLCLFVAGMRSGIEPDAVSVDDFLATLPRTPTQGEAIARLTDIVTEMIEDSSLIDPQRPHSATVAAWRALEAHCRGQQAEFRFWADVFKRLQDADPGS